MVDSRRKWFSVVVSLLAFFLAASGCTSSSSGSDAADRSRAAPSRIKPLPSQRPSFPALGTARPKHGTGWDATVKINAVKRGPRGLTVLYWTLTNTGGEFTVDGAFVPENNYEQAEYYGGGPSAVTLSKPGSGDRYHTLRDTAKVCLCSHIIPGYDSYAIVKGESLTLFNAFKLSSGVQSVTVEIPGFNPIKNVPVQ